MSQKIKTGHVMFCVLLIAAAAGECMKSFFNFSSTDNGKTKYDTNWPNSSKLLPDNQRMDVEKIGLAIRTKDGSAVKAETIGILARSILKVKISDVEVKETTLSEFLSCPVTSNTGATAFGEEITAGPVFVPFKTIETIPGNGSLDFSIEIPASLGQEIEIVAMLKGDHYTTLR